MMDDLDATLNQRGSRYGDFSGHATATQSIKAIIRDALASNDNWRSLTGTQQAVVLEGLDMIAHKIGRIVNGDPTYDDSWIDIEGYSRITRERVCKTTNHGEKA